MNLSIFGLLLPTMLGLSTSSNNFKQPQPKLSNDNGVEVTYKYQSNTAETLGDLVHDNVYRFTITNDSLDAFVPLDSDFYLDFDILYTYSSDFSLYNFSLLRSEFLSTLSSASRINVSLGPSASYFNVYCGSPYPSFEITFESLDYDIFSLDCIILLNDYGFSDTTFTNNFLFYTDYNEIVSAEPVYSSNLYTNIYNFVYNNLFSDSNLNAYHMTILSVDTTLGVWLSHTITIVGLILLVIFLILVIRMIFKIFANTLRSI